MKVVANGVFRRGQCVFRAVSFSDSEFLGQCVCRWKMGIIFQV